MVCKQFTKNFGIKGDSIYETPEKLENDAQLANLPLGATVIKNSGEEYVKTASNVFEKTYRKITSPDDVFEMINTETSREPVGNHIWPIGSIYLSVDSRNPSELFGYGTWERFAAGRVILGAGENEGRNFKCGDRGGEYEHTLTTSEMPTHNHSTYVSTEGLHTHKPGTFNITGRIGGHQLSNKTLWLSEWDTPATGCFKGIYTSITGANQDDPGGGGRVNGFEFDASRGIIGNFQSGGDHSHNVSVHSTGSSNPHNVMQPYIAVNLWRRTA